jgi:hypothetical protein
MARPKNPRGAGIFAAFLLLGASLAARADLVAHYALDELPGSGDTVADSFDKNPATLISSGNVTKGVASPAPAFGTAYDFELRGGANLGIGSEVRPIDQFTMTWWMRPDTLNSFDRIYETLAGTGNSGNGIRIDLGGSPGDSVRVLLRDGNGSTNTQLTHALNLLTNGTWYFVAVRYDSTRGNGSALKLTVLANAASASAANITAATQSPASLGTGPIDLHNTGAYLAADDAGAAGSNDFGGAIDDFAIFQTGDVFGVLSDADLATVFNIGPLSFDPPEPKSAINSFSTSSSSITIGQAVTLSWNVSDTDTVSIEPGIGNVDAQTIGVTGSILTTPAGTTIYTLTASSAEGSETAKLQVVVDSQLLPPVLNEFVANNNNGLLDGDGLASDWIEIHNPNLLPLDLSGYFLTEDIANLVRWPFPVGTILPGDNYLVVFASSQAVIDYLDAGGNLHTNFALRADGEYLALVAPDGSTIHTEFAPAYPSQVEDVSFGPEGFLLSPTPGAPNNGEGVLGFVADTTFSIDRGFYTSPIAVAITSATPGAAIYYTTDGSEPSATNGTLYSVPLNITTTTVLRAVATKENFAPTNVDTQTYLFLEDVIQQSNTQPGYPTVWAGKRADYEMDPNIVNDPAYSADMIEALKNFPTLSIAIDRDQMFAAGGLYQNPQSQGDAWERPVSAELIIPDGSEPGFQVNAGMRIQGGSSRNPDIPKHSLSLRFRRQYGPGKLRYPLFADAPFGNSAVEEFDFLQLRSGFNFAWCHRHYYQAKHAQYNRDQFVNDLYLAMGQLATHGRWVHLYINGLYWGMYHVHERPDGDFMASYFGGEKEDYDALSAGNPRSGDKVAWNAMFAIANGNIANPARYANIQHYLDVNSLIDYMLVNFFVGNTDWDGHNWRAARKRERGAGYLMLPWDSEFAISPNGAGVINSPQPISNALNINVTGKNGSNRPTGLHQRLALNTEYVVRFADRTHKHLFNSGALTRTTASAIWRARSDLMDGSVIAESARWGDFRVDVDPGRWTSADFALYTKNDHYLPDQAWILRAYIPRRGLVLLNQLRSRGLYPATDAPVFAQHGGNVPLNFALTITNPNVGGTIYYTLDGTDPRDPAAGGNLVSATAVSYAGPVTLTQSGLVLARVLNGSEWSALNEASFLAGTLASATTLAVSEIMYNPLGPLEDTEFVELVNLSVTETIELGDAQFVAGIDFTFPLNTTLGPGQRILVVANITAFEAHYGAGFPIAGQFTGSLDNDGEQLILRDASGIEILNFTYNDGAAWPNEADGSGRSLVLRAPNLGFDPNDALSWRDSTALGGNPDGSDATTFSGNPNADDDEDGLSALLEYGLGTSDSVPNPEAGSLSAAIDQDGHLTIQVQINLSASDIETSLDRSSDLASWSPATDFSLDSVTRDAAQGTALLVYRSLDPAGAGLSREFVRWRITKP